MVGSSFWIYLSFLEYVAANSFSLPFDFSGMLNELFLNRLKEE